MLNKTLKIVTVISLIVGFLSLLPSYLVGILVMGSADWGLMFTLMMTLGLMVTLPFPVYLTVKRETRLMEKIKKSVGGRCFIGKAALIDDSGRGTNCFICFNESKILVVAKAGDLREYLNLPKADIRGICFNEQSFDLIIKAVGNKTLRLFTPDPKIRAALSKAGWSVREESGTDN